MSHRGPRAHVEPKRVVPVGVAGGEEGGDTLLDLLLGEAPGRARVVVRAEPVDGAAPAVGLQHVGALLASREVPLHPVRHLSHQAVVDPVERAPVARADATCSVVVAPRQSIS